MNKQLLPMTIELGALAPSLRDQLKSLNLDRDTVKALRMLQLDADAISRLAIHGLIPQSATHNARKKLVNKIKQALKSSQ